MDSVEQAGWKITLFGNVAASYCGVPWERVQNRKVLLLLICLASRPGRLWSRDELCERLWPGEYLEIGRDRLRQTLALLNKALRAEGAESPLIATRTAVELPAGATEVDLSEFRASSKGNPARAVEIGAEEFCPGFVEDWVATERAQVRTEWIEASTTHAQHLLESSRLQDAISVCDQVLSIEPLCEPIQVLRIRALSAAGRGSEALQQGAAYGDRVKKELGLSPSSQLETALADVRSNADPADEERVTWINLSPSLTRFFGRETELAALDSLLSSTPPARLVTITGPGGTGKTKFISEYVARRGNQGRCLAIGLVEIGNVNHLINDLAENLSVSLGDEDSPKRLLVRKLRTTPLLLVCDNCEHLTDELAALFRELLAQCPGLTIVATSRLRLQIAGERELPLPPLELPDGEDTAPAVELFLDRLRDSDPDFQPDSQTMAAINDLCVMAEGVPLAIELAASRASVVGVRELADRLGKRVVDLSALGGDHPNRHKAIRNALEWSIAELSSDLRRALLRLSVFVGGFTLKAAEGVLEKTDVSEELHELRSRSLIRIEPDSDGVRYRILEMVRQYVQELGPQEEVEAATGRHVSFCAELSLHLSHLTRTQGRQFATEGFRKELPNFRAAIAAIMRQERPDHTELVALSTNMLQRFDSIGHIREAAETLRLALDKGVFDEVQHIYTMALYGYAMSYFESAERILEVAEWLMERQATMSEKLRVSVLAQLADMVISANSDDMARRLLAAMEELLPNLRGKHNEDFFSWNVGMVYGQVGDWKSAVEILTRARKFSTEKDARRTMAWSTLYLAKSTAHLGDQDEALKLYGEAIAVARFAGEMTVTAFAVRMALRAAWESGKTGRSASEFAEMLGFEHSIRHQGPRLYPAEHEPQARFEASLREELGSGFKEAGDRGHRLRYENGLDRLEAFFG